MGRDFPNKGEELYDIAEAMHVRKPLKKDDRSAKLKKDEGKSVKPWRRKKMEFIMPIVGPINNWTWVRFFENMEKKFCNASSNVLFNIFNKMNFDLAYFNVSHNIEILNLNDSIRTYVFHMLRTYVMILCNWLSLWQNALYL